MEMDENIIRWRWHVGAAMQAHGWSEGFSKRINMLVGR